MSVFNAAALTVLESISEPLVFMDRQQRYVFANVAALERMRRSREDLIGRYVWEVFPRGADSAFRELIDQALDTGEPTRLTAMDPATTRWLECNCYPSEFGLAVLFRDVTEEHNAEEALRETEARYRAMADTVPVLIWLTDQDDQRWYVNRGWLDYTGRTMEQEQGQGWMSGIHPDDRPRYVETYRAAIAANEPFKLEYRLRRNDGAYRWILDHGIPLPPDQLFKGYIGTCVDIHERRRAEDQLGFLAEASRLLGSSIDFEETLRTVADLVVPRLAGWCAVDLFDEQGNLQRVAVSHVDPARTKWVMEQGKKFPSDPDRPHTLAHVAHSGRSILAERVTDEMLQANAMNEEHLAALRHLGLRSLMVVPLKIRDTSLGAIMLVWAETNSTYTESDLKFAEDLAARGAIAIENARLYREARMAAARLQAFNETLEERVQARTHALDRAVAELKERNKELQDFAYVASHDLQEPLRKIATFGELVEDEYGQVLDDVGRDYLSRMQDAARRMATLINDLLAYSRIASRAEPPRRVDLSALVSQVVADLEVSIREAGGKVEIGDLPALEADETQMRQLFQNLIVNALKFRRKNVRPVVRIAARALADGADDQAPEQQHYEIAVSDNGIGIDARHVNRIFLPFKRLNPRNDYPGTGVGLAICKRIVDRHGGRIWAESTPGHGSTFRITLPARQLENI